MMRPRATEQDTIDPAEELLQLRLMKLKYDFDWSNINRDKRAAELLKSWLECIQGSASISIPTVTHTVAARHPSDLEFNTRAVMMLAQGGHAEAQYKLAQFYLGRGQQDQAVSLLTSAARQGHMPAQFHLIRIFHSGLPDMPRNQEQAKSWVQILTRQLQEEYFETVSANETESTARRLEQFHKQVTDFLKSKPDLADEMPLLLRAHPALDYLSSRGDVVRAVEALNKLLHAFQSHAIISESKWTIANTCNNRRLRMDEQSHELLRPMAVISFSLGSELFTVTDNYLFKLFMKMRIHYHGILEATINKRTCILSIDDEALLRDIPRLCAVYNIQTTAVILDYFQYPGTSQPAAPPRQNAGLVLQKKAFLLELKAEVNNTSWDTKAVKFYGYYTPEHIASMRELLKSLHESSANETVDTLFCALEELMSTIKTKKRYPEVDNLYSRIRSRINDLNQLKPGPDTSLAKSYA